jgi:L-amino acid N-acyltransferase YncA
VNRLLIRPAAEADAESIALIFNGYLSDGGLTDTDGPVSVESRLDWLASRADRYPVWVAEDEPTGDVIGWSSLSPFSPRPEYPWLAEVGMYMENGRRGGGIGDRMLRHTEAAATRLGFRALAAIVFRRNGIVVQALTRRGFEVVATLPGAAKLRGRHEDVIWLWNSLGSTTESG